MHWKTLSSKIVFDNEFFTIHQDKCEKADGKIVEKYFRVERPNVVVVAGFSANGEIILIEQYRYPVQAIDFELPAGYIEKDEEKNIKEAAAREFLEETGYQIENLREIKEAYSSAGLMTNNIYFFIGENARKIQEQNLDEAEDIKVHPTKISQAKKMLEEGKIKDMASLCGLLLALKHYRS